MAWEENSCICLNMQLIAILSRIGVSNAPLFSSENPKEWISFLKKIWTSPDYIKQIKEHNKKYIQEMNEFIQCEYKKFLSKNEIIKI